jgi:hypothetical protein
MPVVVTYFLPVELAALLGAAFFWLAEGYIAVRDKAVDGTRHRGRIAPIIGSAGSTGITTTKRQSAMTDLGGARTAPLCY